MGKGESLYNTELHVGHDYLGSILHKVGFLPTRTTAARRFPPYRGVQLRNRTLAQPSNKQTRDYLSSFFKGENMNAWQWLIDLHSVCHFQTREGKKVGKASNSELKRWFQNKAVLVNGEAINWDEGMDFPVFSVVLFPKNPVTLL